MSLQAHEFVPRRVARACERGRVTRKCSQLDDIVFRKCSVRLSSSCHVVRAASFIGGRINFHAGS